MVSVRLGLPLEYHAVATEQISLQLIHVLPRQMCTSTKESRLVDIDGEQSAQWGIEAIVDAKESGLELFLSPMEGKRGGQQFVEEVRRGIIEDRTVGGEPWAHYPVVYEEHVSNAETWKAFSEVNKGRSYDEQVKPGNFFMSVSLSKENDLYVPGFAKKRIRLIAAKDDNYQRWYEMVWVNKYNPKEKYRLRDPSKPLPLRPGSGLPYLRDGYLLPKTIGEYLEGYRKHPERTFLGPDGEPCPYETKGWMSRMTVMSSETVMTGKEGTRIGKDTENEGMTWEDVRNVHGLVRDRLPDALEVLGDLPEKEAAALGVNERNVRNWLSGKTRPADPEKTIAYAAARAVEMTAWLGLGIEGGDPFDSYKRTRQLARERLAVMPTTALKASGCGPGEAEAISAGTRDFRLHRVLRALSTAAMQPGLDDGIP